MRPSASTVTHAGADHVHAAARQQVEVVSEVGCRRSNTPRFRPVVKSTPGWTLRTPSGALIISSRVGCVRQGVCPALRRGGRVQGVRRAGERGQVFGQHRPVDLIEHAGDRPHPVRAGGQPQERLARCCSRVKSRWVGLWASATVCNTRRTSLASVALARATTAGCADGSHRCAGPRPGSDGHAAPKSRPERSASATTGRSCNRFGSVHHPRPHRHRTVRGDRHQRPRRPGAQHPGIPTASAAPARPVRYASSRLRNSAVCRIAAARSSAHSSSGSAAHLYRR